jgi:hypothetical protein
MAAHVIGTSPCIRNERWLPSDWLMVSIRLIALNIVRLYLFDCCYIDPIHGYITLEDELIKVRNQQQSRHGLNCIFRSCAVLLCCALLLCSGSDYWYTAIPAFTRSQATRNVLCTCCGRVPLSTSMSPSVTACFLMILLVICNSLYFPVQPTIDLNTVSVCRIWPVKCCIIWRIYSPNWRLHRERFCS